MCTLKNSPFNHCGQTASPRSLFLILLLHYCQRAIRANQPVIEFRILHFKICELVMRLDRFAIACFHFVCDSDAMPSDPDHACSSTVIPVETCICTRVISVADKQPARRSLFSILLLYTIALTRKAIWANRPTLCTVNLMHDVPVILRKTLSVIVFTFQRGGCEETRT
jgi:hypothetical protein